MPHFHAQVEFRRRSRGSPWVIAGVAIDGAFWPAAEGVEPLRRRLPEAGLIGWTNLPTPIVAVDVPAAAAVALDVAQATWPERARPVVPYGSGTPDDRR